MPVAATRLALRLGLGRQSGAMATPLAIQARSKATGMAPAASEPAAMGSPGRGMLSDRCELIMGGGSHVSEWNALLKKAEEKGMINLTQGYPDFEGSPIAREAAAAAITDPAVMGGRLNQYSPLAGLGSLQEALVSMYARVFGYSVDPAKELVITSSGTEAVAVAMQALVSPGDEVVLFEPFFPWYAPCVRLAGGTPRFVRLSIEDEWAIREDRLAEVFDPKRTKAIVVNTPHNPTGRRISEDELALVAKYAAQSEGGRCVIVSDEAYEGQCWSAPHAKVAATVASAGASAPPVLTVGTASKLCSLTGWRVGWLTGPPSVIDGCKALHGFTTYCAPTPFQHGVAAALAAEGGDFGGTGELMEGNASRLAAALRDAGARALTPDGGYFVVADVSPMGFDDSGTFCRAMMEHAQVACVPMGMFFASDGDRAPGQAPLTTEERCLVRFAICKEAPVVDEAIRRIKAWRGVA